MLSDLQDSTNQTIFASSFGNIRMSIDLYMRFRRPVIRMPHIENMRSTNACDAGAAITSSAKAGNLQNKSNPFHQNANASGAAFLSAESAI